MVLSMEEMFFRAGMEKNYTIEGDNVTFYFKGKPYVMPIRQTRMSKEELISALKYYTIEDFNETDKGYKFAKSSADIEKLCYEQHSFIEHKPNKCVEDNNPDHIGLSFLLGTQHIFQYMTCCYGDLFVTITFSKQHPEAEKMKGAKIYRQANEYVTDKYLVEEVMDLREPETLRHIIKLSNKIDIYAGMAKRDKFLYFLKEIEAYETIIEFNKLIDKLDL